MTKEIVSGITRGPACPPVVLSSNCTFPACFSQWGAALEEGSPEINSFSQQAGDQEQGAVLLSFQAPLHLI